MVGVVRTSDVISGYVCMTDVEILGPVISRLMFAIWHSSLESLRIHVPPTGL